MKRSNDSDAKESLESELGGVRIEYRDKSFADAARKGEDAYGTGEGESLLLPLSEGSSSIGSVGS